MTQRTDTYDAELKPCPFCGGPVKLEKTMSRQSWGVVCRNKKNLGGTCAIEQIPSASKDAAITRWNRRTPPVGAQSVVPSTVAIHHVKLKTRKRIDAEIPRTMQGWWADVCPGQRMTLRDAYASDIARCIIDKGRSKDPKDYLCELGETGALVARIAIDTIRTEMVPVGVVTTPPRAEGARDAPIHE